MAETDLDVLIIGGGITGAGIALHAAAAGLKVGLVEMQDFAAGTSSRSTKLVHGGLRYLKQFEVEMVADVARERAVLHHNAPHIVKPQMMLLPVYEEKEASFTSFSAPVALELYDKLAEVTPEYHHFFVSKEEVERKEPALRREKLIKGGIYLDYTNDDARLTIEIIKKANEKGALAVNYVEAKSFLFDEQKKVAGIAAEDRLTGETFDIHSTVVVNAAGPWSDEIRRKLGEEAVNERMFPTKGVHFVVDEKRLPVNRPIYTDTGFGDQRMIFVIPRRGTTYFGTTDTPYEGDFVSPKVTQEDVDYLLEAINFRFPKARLTLEDIQSSWAGLRPLISDEEAADPSAISRSHDVFVSEQGLVTIAGGKLTDYRIMAEDTMAPLFKRLEEKEGIQKEVDTHLLPVSGGDLPEGESLEEFVERMTAKGRSIGLSEQEAADLANWYGSNVEKVFEQKYALSSSKGLPLSTALSLEYALKHEMVLTPVDFFLRRTDYLLFETEKMGALISPVLERMKEYLEWTEEEYRQSADQLEEVLEEAQLNRLKK